jgi:hypothetical protein
MGRTLSVVFGYCLGTDLSRLVCRWLSICEEQVLENEHQAAIFVQRQMLRFLERQKAQLRDEQKTSAAEPGPQ